MPLTILPVSHIDVPACISLRISCLGSLVIGRPPPYPGYIEHQEASLHHDLDHSSHIHHLEVVDTLTGEIIAYAKYELYPQGRPDIEYLKQSLNTNHKSVDQYDQLRKVAHEYFSTCNSGEMGQRPHILLALLVTSPEHRRRGAGSMLVRWGIEKSDEMDMLCYMQASEQGRRLYEKCGFETIDTVEFDLSLYGLSGSEKMTEMIRWSTKASEGGNTWL